MEELNSQNLNLNLISLDKFEQLPQKKQNENEKYENKNEIKCLKKKKKKPQKKKLSLSLDNISEASFEPTPNNDDVNAAATTTTVKKKDEPKKLPPPFQPPVTHPQINISNFRPSPFYPPTTTYPQMNKSNFRHPIFYPPVYPPQMNKLKFQPPVVYPLMVQSTYCPQPPPFLPKESIQLKKEKVPLPIIDPTSHKQIVIVKQSHTISSKEQPQNNRPYNPYIIPADMIVEDNYVPKTFPTTDLWFNYLNSLENRLSKHRNNHCIAIDCEMVGIGKKGKYSSLARVSIVNYYGDVIFNKFVKPKREITDYRTKFSGITPELLVDGNDFKQVQKEVKNIMEGHIVVGQSIYFDFKALNLNHPEYLIRDTSLYNVIFGLNVEKGTTPSLKKLSKEILGVNIQEGEHDSIEDAKASMILYRYRQAEWEKYLRANGFPRPKGCKICGSYSHVVRECPLKKRKSKRNNNVDIDIDEYNRDPNTSKYYSYC